MAPVVVTRAELLPIEHRRLFEIAGGLLGLQAAVVRLRFGPELSELSVLHQFPSGGGGEASKGILALDADDEAMHQLP